MDHIPGMEAATALQVVDPMCGCTFPRGINNVRVNQTTFVEKGFDPGATQEALHSLSKNWLLVTSREDLHNVAEHPRKTVKMGGRLA